MSLDPLENLRNLRERQKRATRDEGVSVPWPGGSSGASGGGGVSGLGDTIPEIVDQTGAAGTGTAARRTDCVPKLKLAGAPADTGTAGNATLQFTGSSGGLQVRLAGYAPAVAKLDDIAGADGTGGLGLPVNTNGGLDTNAPDLAVKADAVDANNILAVGANGVTVSALASTSKRGLAPSLTAPAAGIRNILAIDNGETGLKIAALLDDTNPAALGTAAPGTSMIAARRDHVHAKPAASQTFVALEPAAEFDYDTSSDLTDDEAWHELDVSALVTDATALVFYAEFDSIPRFRAPGSDDGYGIAGAVLQAGAGGAVSWGGLITLPIAWGADALEYMLDIGTTGGIRFYGYAK